MPRGQHHAEVRRGAVGDLDQAERAAAPIGGDIGREFGLMGDGRRQADAPRARRQPVEPRQAQRQLIAALGAGQRVHLVDDDRAQPAEHRSGTVAATAARRGFPAWSAECRAAFPAAGRGGSAGVSPVRVSMRMGSAISVTGSVRLRAMSVASAFSGLT